MLESTKAKWVAIVVALFLLLIAFEIGHALLPHKALNTELKYEEKSNGIREYFPNGIREPEPAR